MGLGGWVGCKNDATDRYAYHVARSQGIFGSSQRITVTAAPGLVERCEDSSEGLTACVRAGSPFPRVRIANGDIENKEAILRVSNVVPNILWDVYLEPLLGDEAQDQRCVRDALGPPDDSSMRLGSEEGAALLTRVPACAALVLSGRAHPADGARVYRVAVLGGISMRETELRAFIQRLAQHTPSIDFVYVIGDISIGNRADSMQSFDEIMRDVAIPWTLVMSPARVQKGFRPVADRVGSLDYVTRIFGMPLIVVDTASASISNAQRKMLNRLRQCKDSACAPAAAVMSVPPVSLHTFEVGTFRSQILAQEMLDTLRGVGMRALISSIEKSASKTHFSGIQLFDVGTAQNTEDFLQLSFLPKSPSATLCDGWLSIEHDAKWTISTPYFQCDDDETCHGGVCVKVCENTSDCTAPNAICSERGHCRVPCVNGSCESGVCDADELCDEAPRLHVQQQSL